MKPLTFAGFRALIKKKMKQMPGFVLKRRMRTCNIVWEPFYQEGRHLGMRRQRKVNPKKNCGCIKTVLFHGEYGTEVCTRLTGWSQEELHAMEYGFEGRCRGQFKAIYKEMEKDYPEFLEFGKSLQDLIVPT